MSIQNNAIFTNSRVENCEPIDRIKQRSFLFNIFTKNPIDFNNRIEKIERDKNVKPPPGTIFVYNISLESDGWDKTFSLIVGYLATFNQTTWIIKRCTLNVSKIPEVHEAITQSIVDSQEQVKSCEAQKAKVIEDGVKGVPDPTPLIEGLRNFPTYDYTVKRGRDSVRIRGKILRMKKDFVIIQPLPEPIKIPAKDIVKKRQKTNK